MDIDDDRIEWIRKQVYFALDIKELEVFQDLLERDDGEKERLLGKFLNDTPDENESSILFYKITKEEEEEVEVECGKNRPNQLSILLACQCSFCSSISLRIFKSHIVRLSTIFRVQ